MARERTQPKDRLTRFELERYIARLESANLTDEGRVLRNAARNLGLSLREKNIERWVAFFNKAQAYVVTNE